MAKSLEQKVQELPDREEIKELTAKYCWHVQHSEGEKIARLFTEDGVLEATRQQAGARYGGAAEVLRRDNSGRIAGAIHP